MSNPQREIGKAIAAVLIAQFVANHNKIIALYAAGDFEAIAKLSIANGKIAALLSVAKQQNELPDQQPQKQHNGGLVQ